jgi:gamma-glutamyltranspeptidase
MIMNTIDFDMNILQALSAPRIAFNEPNTLSVEPEIAEAVRKQLESMGHQVRERHLGNAHGLTIEYDESGKPVRFTGASDPRGAGLAKGY